MQRTISPVDNSIYVEREPATAEQIDHTLDVAVRAQREWKAIPIKERAALCLAMVEAFVGRSERELSATGERVHRRRAETREDLTAQEGQIARLAREGLSNTETGERLFVSPRTVEYHLRKVFTKLGIGSRGELERALPREPGRAVAV